uniref:tRNA (guanine(26)-N(2))-dimethyltransferase n=1 Tax=Panagrellus redivivus TaxID=6233 RepID=A0A7E4VZN3_PANRE
MSKIITEGQARMLVADSAAGTESFYNPVQEFNRDLTVTFLREFAAERLAESEERADNGEPSAKKSRRQTKNSRGSQPLTILDALSASGLRAIRFAKEVPNVGLVTANDFSRDSVEHIKKNIAENQLDGKVVANLDDAKAVMMAHREPSKQFDVVDLDPYGTAAPFLDSAVQAVVDGGMLMVTCTDMAVLCGNTPEAAYLKYGSIPVKHRSCHEMALRILLRTIDSHANRYGRYIEPLASFSIDFYVRVFVKVHTSPSRAKESVTKVSNVLICTGCNAFELVPLVKTTPAGNNFKYTPAVFRSKLMSADDKCVHCEQSVHMGGPLYSAPIHNAEFVEKLLTKIRATPVAERLGTHARIEGMLSVVSEELPSSPLYYIMDDVFSLFKVNAQKSVACRSAIINAGFKVSGTHCNAKGVKTDAPITFLFAVAQQFAKDQKANPAVGQIGKILLRKLEESTEKYTVDFKSNAAAVPDSVRQKVVRYQQNYGKNWGPKQKAKGSVNALLTASKSTTTKKAEPEIAEINSTTENGEAGDVDVNMKEV